MFTRKPKPPTELDLAIARLFVLMNELDPEGDQYAAVTAELVKLRKLKKETEPSMPINPEVLLTAGANILGILLIIGYERNHIITTKAVGFVKKLW